MSTCCGQLQMWDDHASTVLILILNQRHGVCLFKWYCYASVLTRFNVERSLRQHMRQREVVREKRPSRGICCSKPCCYCKVLTSFNDESACNKQLPMWEDHATNTLPIQQYSQTLMLKKSLANITGICVHKTTMPATVSIFNFESFIRNLRTCCHVDVGVRTAWHVRKPTSQLFPF
jgi:hypothetical protein